MSVQILPGDCREVLKRLSSGSVDCIVTSPPYYGLRDYETDGQIGLEPTLEAYLETMVRVFRECRRVLSDEGTLWLNMGDSYANDTCDGMKPKDLMGVPWALAFALRQDGWYLRQDIIWHKPSPMPESVGDRCTKAHEYLFLLSKSPSYYYDQDAIRTPASPGWDPTDCKTPDGWDTGKGQGGHGSFHRAGREKGKTGHRSQRSSSTFRRHQMRSEHRETFGLTRGTTNESCTHPHGANKRSVWTVPAKPFKEAHFATFPPALIEPCILAGCPPGGTVLDPFGGAGTTALVADRLQRSAILIEVKPAYVDLSRDRVCRDAPLFADVAISG